MELLNDTTLLLRLEPEEQPQSEADENSLMLGFFLDFLSRQALNAEQGPVPYTEAMAAEDDELLAGVTVGRSPSSPSCLSLPRFQGQCLAVPLGDQLKGKAQGISSLNQPLIGAGNLEALALGHGQMQGITTAQRWAVELLQPLPRLEIVRATRLQQAEPLLPETLKFGMNSQAALGRELTAAQA